MNVENVEQSQLVTFEILSYTVDAIITDPTMENQLHQETCILGDIHAINSLEDGNANNLNTGFDNTDR